MKTRRILISILVIAMLTTVIVIPSAVTDAAYACARLNLLRGEENGITDEYLSKETTRAQSLLISLRLNGLERSARYFKGDYNFNDLSDLN